MKRRRLYRISVADETRLEQVASWSFAPWKLTLLGIGICLLLMGIGATLVWLSPLRQLMPGYMRKEQRAVSEIAALRIDSLAERLQANRAYIENIRTLLDPSRQSEQPPAPGEEPAWQEIDSLLLIPTENEERFVSSIGKRDRFNSMVLAPLDAEGMIFHFPATQGTFSSSRDPLHASLTLARDASVCAVADGRVVGVARSIREKGYVVWIQHSNGFLSRYARLGSPLVDQGTQVAGGEAIAVPARNAGTNSRLISLQLYHNGEPLPPREYLPSSDENLLSPSSTIK